MIIAAGMWETSHLIHIRDFGVEIIKTFWEKAQNNPKSFIPFASSVGQDKMLARTRQYTWSQLIMNKNKQMILISSLLNPFTQFPFSIDRNTNNTNSDVFCNPFPPSASPSYCFFLLSMKFRSWQSGANSPMLSPQGHPGALCDARVAPWCGRLSGVAIFSRNREGEEETVHGTSADLPDKRLCPGKGSDMTVQNLNWQEKRVGMQILFRV